jgi:hypothetical protein
MLGIGIVLLGALVFGGLAVIVWSGRHIIG